MSMGGGLGRLKSLQQPQEVSSGDSGRARSVVGPGSMLAGGLAGDSGRAEGHFRTFALSHFRTSGFTLVELMVVIVIVGIGALTAAPAFRAEGTAGASAKALARVWADARGEAARRGGTVAVVLDAPAGGWVMVWERDGARSDTLRRGILAVPDGARMSGEAGGRAVARFDALGRGRADRVRIVHEGERHEVSVDAWTGDARVRPF